MALDMAPSQGREQAASYVAQTTLHPPTPGPATGLTISLSVLSLVVLLLYILRNQIYREIPLALRPFAAEDKPYSIGPRRFSIWSLLLGAICLSGLVVATISAVLRPEEDEYFLQVAPWALTALHTAIERPIRAPRLLLVQYLMIFTYGLVTITPHLLNPTESRLDPLQVARTLLAFLAILTIGNMPLRDPSWDASGIGSSKKPPSISLRSPEDNLTLFQFWTMSWVYPLARAAGQREIAEDDVWQLPFDFQHTRLYMAFRDLQGKLLRCLIQANGLDLLISTVLSSTEKVAEVSNIRLTSELYGALDRKSPREAAMWCLVMLGIDGVRQVSKTCGGWYARKAYERSRGETFIALFGKLLSRAVAGSESTEKEPGQTNGHVETDEPAPRGIAGLWSRFFGRQRKWTPVSTADKDDDQPQSASNAKVVNLVRGDTYEISQRFWEFSRVVSQPIKVLVTVYYLIDIMGWSSCVGFVLMGIFLVCNSALVGVAVKLERQRAAHSDRRAQAVAHFVEASRPLKLNGWTASWSNRIMRFRDLEMAKRLQISIVTAAISTVNVLGGATYPLASICLYTLVFGDGLPNDVIWPSLALFAQLEASVKEAFDLVSAFWKATIPVERVNKYMDEPDRDGAIFDGTAGEDYEFVDASFSRPATETLVLRNMTCSIGPGLTIVRGKVGAGKSSFLLALLNEMEHRGGTFSLPNEPMAYAQQLPWLQNKTIRENILFHQPYDPERYKEVLYACALSPDLGALLRGDLTKLEEGGIGLSGGQKARVALARALYSQCRILLLDDPLAALDHDTATLIVQRFVCGPLAKDRVIVMVTHRDDLVLRHADQVIEISKGTVRVLSPAELLHELEHPYHSNRVNGTAVEAADSESEELEIELGDKEAPEEVTETGTIPISIYSKYMVAGGWYLWIFLAAFYGISRFCDISRARLLEAWGNESAKTLPSSSASSSSDHLTSSAASWGLPNPSEHPEPWLYLLSALSAAQIVSYAAAQLLLARISISAAKGLFKNAIDRVSKASFRYHDTTPTGQLKNRLIADMGMVDGGILAPLEAFVFNFIALTLSLVAIMSHQPALAAVLAGVAVLFVYFFRIYVPVSRCLRRMEMRYLTPIIANIGVMQDGLVTIRALRVEGRFQDRHLDAVDDFQKQDHFFWSMAFWLDFRLGVSSAVMRAVLILSMIWYQTPASAVGFVLTQTTIAMAAVQQLCENFAKLQLDAVSLERVDALNRIPEEPSGDQVPPEDWPRPCDAIRFDAMSFKYADDLPAVLDDVTFEIPGGSTCAVLGRTGSGKSTIANALLATQAPAAGSVRIGSVDLARVDRTALRNRVTFIQQDPTLFPGTLQDNIDPEGRFADEACTAAIRRVLGPGWALDAQIDAGGKNLSQGQRQLVGIGRAVLRRSGLVILDEATASIDRATAARVQRILRDELAQSTVITIAHRLEAVEDANWCLRLEQGRVTECGPAGNLDGAVTE